MKTLTLTSSDFDSNGIYIGKTDLSNFDGNLKIKVDYAYFTKSIFVTGYIKASDSIKASGSIKAGGSIEAGGYIEAGNSIIAGNSIEAGFTIACEQLSAKLRIFAGICTWKIPTDDEMLITCEKLVSGIIAFGKLNIIKSEKQTSSCVGKVVEIDGKKYKLVEA
jgi:uncharacterized protein (DUF342 family)